MKTSNIIFGATAIIIFIIIYNVIFASNGLLAQQQVKHENIIFQNKIDSLQGAVDSLKTEIQLLQSDSFYMEYMARTKFGMSKKGETVIKLVNDSTSASP